MRGDQLGEPSTLAEALDRVTQARRPAPWKNPHAGRVDPSTKTARRAKNKRGPEGTPPMIWWCLVGWWWRPLCWCGRVLLWLVAWPLGLWRSIRHGQRHPSR